MVQNRIFWTIVELYYIGYYPIRSYRKIKVYRVESMDMGRSQWKKMSLGRFLISISTAVLIIRDKIPW